MQLVFPLGGELDPNTDEHGRLMGVADDLLDQTVSSAAVFLDYAIPERVVSDRLHCGMHVAFFFMKETLAIADQELEISDLRPVNCGIKNLGQDAVGEREPHPARDGISGSNSLLGAGTPCRAKSWAAKRTLARSRLPHKIEPVLVHTCMMPRSKTGCSCQKLWLKAPKILPGL